MGRPRENDAWSTLAVDAGDRATPVGLRDAEVMQHTALAQLAEADGRAPRARLQLAADGEVEPVLLDQRDIWRGRSAELRANGQRCCFRPVGSSERGQAP